MPELPEVTTTVNGLNSVLKKLTVTDVWSDYHVRAKKPSPTSIKTLSYFNQFKKELIKKTFLKAERRGKNILMHFSGNKTVLIHMKMTGHLLYGHYMFDGTSWKATVEGPLQESWNQFIHFTLSFSNGNTLAFSDMRKFAKVSMTDTQTHKEHADIAHLGPEPLTNLTSETLHTRLLTKPNSLIKSVLMDQTVVAGIGNIYSDEILWKAGVHPKRRVHTLSQKEVGLIFKAMIETLNKGIDFGGDSMSDYRNIHGERGAFQLKHNAYHRTKETCTKKGCSGNIAREVIGGRSAHFCNVHQM